MAHIRKEIDTSLLIYVFFARYYYKMERKLQTVRKYLQCIGLTTFVSKEHKEHSQLKNE